MPKALMHAPLLGIFIKLISVAFVMGLAVAIKTFPDDAPISQIVFFRVFLSLPFVLGWVAFEAGMKKSAIILTLTPNNLWLHIRRSFLGMTSMALLFLSFQLLPLPIASAIKELTPLLITVFAVVFLGESIRIFRTIGLLMGGFGVALISFEVISGLDHAQNTSEFMGIIAALSATITMALAQIQIRSMVATEHPSAVVFWFFIFTALTTLCFMPFGWIWPSMAGWLWIIAIGFFGAVTQLSLTLAYKFADASTVAPFDYFSIPLALLIGGLAFREWPSPLSLLGIAFILVGGLIIIYRERKIAKRSNQ